MPLVGPGGTLRVMTKAALREEFRKLSLSERLELVEELWDSIAADCEREPFPLSEEQRADLERRLAESANPIAYITNDDPPFLIMHGDQDPLVPLSQSRLLHEALEKGGVKSNLYIVKGAGHGFVPSGDMARTIVDFFDRNLKPATSSQPD